MSRGLGSPERAIIEALTTHANNHAPMDDFDPDGQLLIAEYEFDHPHGLRDVPPSFLTAADLAADSSRAALESTKRALHKLAADGTVETCRGRNHVLGARITPPEDVIDQWWLALDDHLQVQWCIDKYAEMLSQARAELRVELRWQSGDDRWHEEQKRKNVEYLEPYVRMTYAEMRQHRYDHLPSTQANRKPPTEEEARANGDAVRKAAEALHGAAVQALHGASEEEP